MNTTKGATLTPKDAVLAIAEACEGLAKNARKMAASCDDPTLAYAERVLRELLSDVADRARWMLLRSALERDLPESEALQIALQEIEELRSQLTKARGDIAVLEVTALRVQGGRA